MDKQYLKELQEQFDALQVDMLTTDLDFYDRMWPIAVESEGDVNMVMRQAEKYLMASWNRYHEDPESMWADWDVTGQPPWLLLNTKATLDALVERLRDLNPEHKLVEVWDAVFSGGSINLYDNHYFPGRDKEE